LASQCKTSFLTPQIIKPIMKLQFEQEKMRLQFEQEKMKLQFEQEKMRLQLTGQFGIWI
jgi:hypothetical protein